MPEEVRMRKIALFGLKDTTQSEVEEYFAQYGEVEDAVVLKDG